MNKINNEEILALFARDVNRNFYYCYDTEMAGRDGYKIKEIAYFVNDISDPLSSFVCVKTYWDDSLVVNVYSDKEKFWAEAVAKACGYIRTRPCAEFRRVNKK